MGLYPRPDRAQRLWSVRQQTSELLFTVWPQWDEGGSFKILENAGRVCRLIPEASIEAA